MRSTYAVAAAFAFVVIASCFSDRHDAMGPIDDTPECQVPGFAIGTDHRVVFVRRFTFMQDTIRIRPGMSVTWVNCEAANIEAHTSTSEDGVWDSGPFGPGETYTRTFTTAGTFDYFCRPHPTMRGVVIVN